MVTIFQATECTIFLLISSWLNPGFFGGFVPEVQRHRRAVGEEECCIFILNLHLSSICEGWIFYDQYLLLESTFVWMLCAGGKFECCLQERVWFLSAGERVLGHNIHSNRSSAWVSKLQWGAMQTKSWKTISSGYRHRNIDTNPLNTFLLVLGGGLQGWAHGGWKVAWSSYGNHHVGDFCPQRWWCSNIHQFLKLTRIEILVWADEKWSDGKRRLSS